jgi:hypothetical protein
MAGAYPVVKHRAGREPKGPKRINEVRPKAKAEAEKDDSHRN